MRTINRIARLAGVLVCSLAWTLAPAVTMVPVNLAQIVEHTEKAFVGTVTGSEVVQLSKGWADKITVKVSDPVLGSVKAGDTVTWLQYRIGKEIPVAGMPKYKVGDEHLIFLAGKGRNTEFQAAYGLGQGSFRVHREKATGKALVRNDFMNAHLFENLDTALIADTIVGQDAKLNALTADKRAAAAKRVEANVTQVRTGASDLDSMKNVVKALGSKPTPSQAFKGQGAKGQRQPLSATVSN